MNNGGKLLQNGILVSIKKLPLLWKIDIYSRAHSRFIEGNTRPQLDLAYITIMGSPFGNLTPEPFASKVSWCIVYY